MAIEDYVREKINGFDAYTSYHDKDFNREMRLGQPFRKEMEEDMITLSHYFLRARGADEETIERGNLGYWYSMYYEGQDHHLHTHPGALCAGTYYPYANKRSSPIKFRNPSSTIIGHAEQWSPKSRQLDHHHQPVTGDMLVWPCWLEHEVRVERNTRVNEERIAISWNYQ
tara:strand:- start:68 stop:577 length:510 start_codon:yes stop_codon:yes gene_type:complete